MDATSSATPFTVATSPLILIEAESLSSKGTKLVSLKPIKFCKSTFSNCIFFSI